MPEIRTLKPRRTLNGKFDAYCHVCWNAVYCLWIDDEDPAGLCQFGHARAVDCPDARAHAANSAAIADLMRRIKADRERERSIATWETDGGLAR